ncbi:MAG: DUF2934 domain-containing protein [Nitrospirales bacterium]
MNTQTSHQGTKKPAHLPSDAQSGSAVPNSTSASPVTSSFDDRHARISARAYALYVQRGRRDGGALEDWLEAEQDSIDRTFLG